MRAQTAGAHHMAHCAGCPKKRLPQGTVSSGTDPRLLQSLWSQPLRGSVEDFRGRGTSEQQAYDEWKAAVGNTKMDHLLKDGWIPFLSSLSHPDPDLHLLHGVATELFEIAAKSKDSARLNAFQ
jgi:hypothetical protein